MEVKNTFESTLEERKLEVNQSLQNKLTKGAEKRAQELQKIMETAKKHVNIFSQLLSIKFHLFIFISFLLFRCHFFLW